MFWARSQLFWKIVGLYVLFSLLALVSLILTLHAQLDQQSELAFRDDLQVLAAEFADELSRSEDSSAVVGRWQAALQIQALKVWLVDASAKSLVDSGEPVPERAVIQSAVRTAARSGTSQRWMTAADSAERALIVTHRCAESATSPRIVLLLGDASRQRAEYRRYADAATRGAVYTWLTGLICVVFIAMGLVGPLRVMTENLGTSVDRLQRQDMLLRISDRQDELGHVAQSLTALEEVREDQICALQEAGLTSQSAVELLSAVLDSMVEGVIAVDEQERILFLNAAARRLLGISQVIGVGHRLYEAVRVPAVLDTIAEAIKSHSLQSLEFRTTREGLQLALVVNPIRKGAHSGAVAVVRDISEMRRLEAMRRDFVSGVSHELKTPLTVIQACTDTLLDGAVDDPDTARRFLKQIEEQSDRLLQLILGMLQLARMESGAQVFHPEPLEVHELAADVLNVLRPVAEGRAVSLCQTGLPQLMVTADEQALRTVLSNLVDNAIKHTPAGGRVTLALLQEPTGPVISVRDTGVGIAPEHLPRIFERFYRIDRDRSREQGGTGLGLAIVKHLCQIMQATVTVRSEPGRGTEFRVQFPPR